MRRYCYRVNGDKTTAVKSCARVQTSILPHYIKARPPLFLDGRKAAEPPAKPLAAKIRSSFCGLIAEELYEGGDFFYTQTFKLATCLLQREELKRLFLITTKCRGRFTYTKETSAKKVYERIEELK